MIKEQKIGDFLNAVAASGLSQAEASAALHHSAVEVNDWERIQGEMKKIEDKAA